MANSDKNIVITPFIGNASSDPQIVFSGANANVGPQNITLSVLPTSNGTLSFSGSAGQLFSVTNNLTGTIFSVNDVSGIPSIEVLSTGTVKLAQYNGNVLIGGTTTDGVSKLQVTGAANVSSLRIAGFGQVISNTGTWTGPSSGLTGNIGATGASGVQGTIGATGPQGTIGATGLRGTTGFNGATGATGPQGNTGATGPSGGSGGSNTQVIFNDAGVANGNAGFTFIKSTAAVNVTGNITGNNIITGISFNSNTLPGGNSINTPGFNGLKAGPVTVASGTSFTVTTVLVIV